MHWQLPVLWVEQIIYLFIVDLQIGDSQKELTIQGLQETSTQQCSIISRITLLCIDELQLDVPWTAAISRQQRAFLATHLNPCQSPVTTR